MSGFTLFLIHAVGKPPAVRYFKGMLAGSDGSASLEMENPYLEIRAEI